MVLDAGLKTYAEWCDARLAELIPPAEEPPSELHAAMRYSCLAEGKRLRPMLCLASAKVVGGSVECALDAACALEMVHCFSLIHDDLPAIDDDDLRRGAPTCHVMFGEALAILAGDALFALAYETLSNCKCPSDRLVLALRSLSWAAGSLGLVGGEVLDVLSEGKQPTEAMVNSIHRRKTGALIASSCEIGGLLGGADPRQLGILVKYGEHVGMAFQILDDILNETSTPEQLGKAAGSDRERMKATYPAVAGLDGARKAAEAAAQEACAVARELGEADELVALAEFAAHRLN